VDIADVFAHTVCMEAWFVRQPNCASTFYDQFSDFSARIGMACGVKTFRS